MSDAPLPTDAPNRKVVWIVAVALVLGLGWLFFNQQSCNRWREDVRTAQEYAFSPGAGRAGNSPHDAGFLLVALEEEEPPFCSPPEVEQPRQSD